MFQYPLGLELLHSNSSHDISVVKFQCPHGLELLLTVPMLAYLHFPVSMPSRAWVVTINTLICMVQRGSFNALTGLSCYEGAGNGIFRRCCVSMPSRAWVVTQIKNGWTRNLWQFQCPLGLELLHQANATGTNQKKFQCPLGLELLQQECPIF